MFRFGVDYYPEHWPEERWEEDASLMAEANFNVVRLAEFAWSKMEPEEGKYDFEWLNRIISIMDSRGIHVVLGTPTASPPPWLMSKDKSLFLVEADGHRLTYGHRRGYCPNNPIYHEYSRKIVQQMAEHYKDNSTVIGWQIDNEFGARCYCDICKTSFQRWLNKLYKSLDALNERWGTVFWSQSYTDWDEIPVPVITGKSPNPGLGLDFYRFMTDSYRAYQLMQISILREKCPEHFITHNLMGFKYDQLDYFEMTKDLDFVSWDNYWRTQWNMENKTDPSWAALGHDTIRGLRHKNFWVMEQQSGAGGWEFVSVAPKPGEIRLWAYQSIAHGADGILFFRWRTCRFGTEQYWHGVLDHHGEPGRRYYEIKKMGDEIKTIGDQIQGRIIKPEVAMVLSYDSRFAFQLQANNPRFDYPTHFHDIYRAFFERNVQVDVVAPMSDLNNYKIVIAPALHVLPEMVAENLMQYVREGGLLVVTPRSGVKDEFNAVVNQVLPGLLAELCGVEVEEYLSMPIDMDGEIKFSTPGFASIAFTAQVWCDVLKPNDAQVIARYQHDYLRGKPAITLNQYGKGKVVYIGTLGEPPFYNHIVTWLLEVAGIEPSLSIPIGVEVSHCWQEGKRLLFLLNHSDEDKRFTMDDKRYRSLMNGSSRDDGSQMIQKRGVRIFIEV
jgi:beta-galactosidase